MRPEEPRWRESGVGEWGSLWGARSRVSSSPMTPREAPRSEAKGHTPPVTPPRKPAVSVTLVGAEGMGGVVGARRSPQWRHPCSPFLRRLQMAHRNEEWGPGVSRVREAPAG
jgi:hypothetical protein